MKVTIMLDTLAFANQLKAAGVAADIAEAHAFANAKLLEGLLDTTLATKYDLAELETKLELRIDSVKKDINHLEKDFYTQLKDLETRLTIRIGVILTGILGIFSALSSFIHLAH